MVNGIGAMRSSRGRLVVGFLCLLAAVSVGAADASKHPNRRFICAGQGVVCRVAADGAIEWQHRTGGACYDVWQRPNGNVLFTFKNGAREIDPAGKTVWEYLGPKGCEIHSCSHIADGLYLVGEASASPRILEIDSEGTVVKAISVQTKTKRVHGQFRQVRKTAAGTYLLAQTSERKVCEYGADGALVRTMPVPGNPFVAVRLPDGNTLIACGEGHQLIEVDPNDSVVWCLSENDLPGNPLRFVAGIQRLPNGNTLVCNWGGHGHVRKQPQIFEVTRDKRVVWQFDDKERSQFRTIASVQILQQESPAKSAIDMSR